MFASEFVEPVSGRSLVFYQSLNNPLPHVVPKYALGEATVTTEKTGYESNLYHAKTPYDRDVLVFRYGKAWLALSAAGLSMDDLLEVTQHLDYVRAYYSDPVGAARSLGVLP